jgi:hypothetical protein
MSGAVVARDVLSVVERILSGDGAPWPASCARLYLCSRSHVKINKYLTSPLLGWRENEVSGGQSNRQWRCGDRTTL